MSDERQASERLETAIHDWLAASGMAGAGDMTTGWVLLAETIEMTEGDAGITITTSDDMTLVRQLGMLDYAQVIARQAAAE